jgi:hypothetical protein
VQETERPWNWPVNWAPAVGRATTAGLAPDVVLAHPDLTAHRTLDRLAARARAVNRNTPGAKKRFIEAIGTLARGAPWLLEVAPDDPYDKNPTADDCGCAASRSTASMIDESGVMALLSTAAQAAGSTGAKVVHGLVAAATAAEALLPSFAEPGDEGERADLATLTNTTGTFLRRPGEVVELGAEPAWARLTTLARQTIAAPPTRCVALMGQLVEELPPEPVPEQSVTWTTGIQGVEVIEGCSTSPGLIIRGSGFGATHSGVGVIASMWDKQTWTVVHARVSITSWSDTEVRVSLGSRAVSGSVAFLDLNFLKTYRDYAEEQNAIAKNALRAAGCPAVDILSTEYNYAVATSTAAQYSVAAPVIAAEISHSPSGAAANWNFDAVHLEAGQAFRVFWRAANADSAALKAANAAGESVLSAAGLNPTTGVPGLTGTIYLTAPAQAAVVEFRVEARNAACGVVRKRLRIVVTGKPLRQPTITVLQSLPGGDIDVVTSGGAESFNPAGGRSIPLVAEKRTIVRVDWWPGMPQVPEGERIEATATLRVRNRGDYFLSGTLLPNESTAEPPSSTGVILPSGPPFASAAQYDQWVAGGGVPATFNFVMPPEWCKWEVILEPTINASPSFGPLWTASTAVWAKFHRRRRVRIRYRRHTVPGTPAPTTEATAASLRVAGSLLPIPDPEIVVLTNDPAVPSTGYIEDMMRERANTPAAQWKDEIWLVIGPVGVGGVADPNTWPWTGATEATGTVTAHEIGHMFNQGHLKLCGAAQNPDDPATFPDQGNVLVTGWDTWNNREVRNGIDLMSYCWGNAWISPERWRRVFLRVGKP